MAVQNPYQQYAQNQVTTAPPEELTLMLYKGAVKFINLAIKALENKSYTEVNTNLIKAQNIYYELLGTLNHNYEISKELATLYDFIIYLLVQGNIKKDREKLDQALDIAKDFVATWEEAIKVYRKAQAPAEWVK